MSYPNKRESLLTQLESMHKQLNDETRKRSGHSDLKGDNRRLPGPFGRPERNSMPMFAGSSTHAGLLATNNNQDMTFVMGLSENLLVECRRLQAENEAKTRKLKSIKQDYEEMKNSHQKLSNTHQVAAQELQSLRDCNWELEDKLKSLSCEFETLRDKFNKNSRCLKQETEHASRFRTDLEVAELKLKNLETQLDSANNEHAVQIAELRKHISDLNDENDALHSKNKELRDGLKNDRDAQYSFGNVDGEKSNIGHKLEQVESNHYICSADLSAEQLAKVERMKKGLKTVGFTVLERTRYEDTLDKAQGYDNPSVEYLTLKANELGKRLISSEELDQLQDVPLTSAINKVEHSGYKVLENDSYQKIVSQAETPSLDFLKSKLEQYDCKAIPSTELSREPDLPSVTEDAKKLGYTVVANDLHSQTQKNLTSPSLEFLKQIIQEGDIKTILHGLADERKVVLLEKQEFERLDSCFSSPTKEFLAEKAGILGYQLIKRERLDELVTLSETPDITFLSDKAEDLGYCLIERTELESLKEKIQQSTTLAFLRSHAEEQGHEIIDMSLYDQLTEHSNRPKLEHLQQKASLLGCDLIDESSHEELTRNVVKPSESELSDVALGLGLVTMPKAEYEETKALIERPPLTFLQDRAQEQGLSLLPIAELEELKDSTKDRSKVISAAKAFGLVPVPISELEVIKSSSLAASCLQDLKKRLRDLGHVAISDQEYENLTAALIPKTRGDGNVLCCNHDLAACPQAKHCELDELQGSQSSLHSRHLENKENSVNCIHDDPQNTKSEDTQIKSPNINSLTIEASQSGHCLIAQKDMEDLERKLMCPSREELERLASKKELVLVPQSEYAENKFPLKNLTVEKLQAEALLLGYVLVSTAEYEHMQREYNNPSEAYLSQKANTCDKLLLERTVYESLRQQSINPSERFLAEHAAALGKILVSKSEYKKTLAASTTSSRELLEKKVADAGLALVGADAIESYQTSVKLLKVLKNAGFELTSKANGELLLKNVILPEENKSDEGDKSEFNPFVLSTLRITEKFQDFERSVKNGSFVLINKDDYQSSIDACNKKITKREVINICPRFGLVPLPSERYNELTKDPSLDHIRSLAEHHASVVVMREQLDMLKAQAESPSWDTIQRSIDQKGMVIVNRVEYESMISKYNSPTKIEVERQAEKLGMIAIPTEKYEGLLKDLQNRSSSATPSPSSKVLANKQYFEQVIRNQNKQSDKLYEPTKTLGFVTLSNDEYKKLKENQKSYNFTKTDIYNGAKAFSLAVLPIEEYKALLKRKPVSESFEYEILEEIAAKFNMKLVPFNLDSPTPCRRKSIAADSGESLKFHDQFSILTSEPLLSKDGLLDDGKLQTEHDEHDEPKPQKAVLTTTNSTAITNASDDSMRTDVPGKNLTPGSSNAGRSADEIHGTIEELRARAITFGYGLVTLSNLEEQEVPELSETGSSQDESDSDEPSDLDEQTLMKEAEKKDLVLIPKAEYESFLAVTSSPMKREQLEVEASKLDLIILTREEYDELLEKSEIDACRIEKLAPQFGLTTVKEDYLHQLETQLANDRLTVDNIKVKASGLGYVALTSSEFTDLEQKAKVEAPKITPELLETEASNLGLKVTPKTTERGLSGGVSTPDPSNSQIGDMSSSSHQLAPNTHNASQQDSNQKREMPADLTVDDIVRWASEFKLVPIEMEQFEQIKEELSSPTLTKAEIIEQARRHSLVAIPESEYNRLSKSSIKNSEEQQGKSGSVRGSENANDTWDRCCTYDSAVAHLKVIAERFKLFRAPEGATEHSTLSGAKRLVILSDVYYGVLLEKQKALAIKVTKEKIRLKDEKLASIKLRNQQLSQSPALSESKMDVQTSRSSLKSPVKSVAPTSPASPFKAPRSASHSAAFTFKHSRSPSLVARNENSSIARSNSMGAISLATVASLSEPSIIPALTQTVIGEYLHKYYPYLGSFGLSARHERFFWVHPYTLTLYWSTTNPVLSNPSTHKTKCAAIISVESVVDTNPYPAGLYHKSIIVHSENKKVKITCATRQRHNIWYNSLRYLIQRSMEGINLEDIADDPTDTMYSGKIFPLQGENAKTANQRLSSSRRSVKTRMRKSASMPIKHK